ncbi:hypothetical protein niasHS_003464 [Heterodera schachtii]|uniref:Uncharacterized protein n=1 Tax=Heterodera schachtii TaxID=97005 RepID=A0ABD2KHB5_HETSC
MHSLAFISFAFCLSLTEAFRTQSSGVRGTLLCGGKALADTKVKLYDHDKGPDADDLMGTTKTDEQGRFQVSGKTTELTTIDVQLRIYHDCDDGMMPCQRKVTFNIPDSYVTSGAVPAKFFDIGTVNMQIIFDHEERSCIN